MAFPTEIFTSGINNTAKIAGTIGALGLGGVGSIKAGIVKRIKLNERGVVLHNGDPYRKRDHWLIWFRDWGYGKSLDAQGQPVPVYSDWLEKRRKGMPYPYKTQGLRTCIPLKNIIMVVNVGEVPTKLGAHNYDIDGKQRRLESEVVWRVRPDEDNPIKSLFKPENSESLAGIVASYCLRGLNEVLTASDHPAINDYAGIETRVKAVSSEHLAMRGVELINLNLHETRRSEQEVTNDGIREGAAAIAAVLSTALAAGKGPIEMPYLNGHNGHGVEQMTLHLSVGGNGQHPAS